MKLKELLILVVLAAIFVSGMILFSRYCSSPYSPCTDEAYVNTKKLAFEGIIVAKTYNHQWVVYIEFDNGKSVIGGDSDIAKVADIGDSVFKKSGTIYCTLQKKDKTTVKFPLTTWLEQTDKNCDSTSRE